MPIKIHFDDGELTIQGFERIKIFEPTIAVLLFPDQQVTVEGSELRCVYFASHEITFVGRIDAVRLSHERPSSI